MKINIYPSGPRYDGFWKNGKRNKPEKMIFASDN